MSIQQIKNSSNIKKTTVVIDSEYASNGSNVNFLYMLPNPLEDVRLVEITNVEFTNDSYNINDYNNQITFVDTVGVTQQVTLDNGNYYIDDLLEEVQVKMNEFSNDNSNIFTVGLNDDDRVVISTYSGVSTFELNWTNEPSLNIADTIGFSEHLLQGESSYTGDRSVDLIYSQKMYIGSTELSDGGDRFDFFDVSIGTTNIIKQVDIDVPYGSIVSDKTVSNFRVSKEALTTIDIYISDDMGRDFLLLNNNFKITMDIYSRLYTDGFSV